MRSDPYDAVLDERDEARYDGADDREREERDRYNALSGDLSPVGWEDDRG